LVGLLLRVLPALLLARNLGAVRALNTPEAEDAARAILAQPLPRGALVVGDWFSTEGPRYLQAIEGLRPDVQFGIGVGRNAIDDALRHGRAVYLVEPDLRLGLAQWPEGRLWRLGDEPLAAVTTAAIRWDEGVTLAGYTLRAGPYAPGEKVPLMLEWQAQGAPRADYTLFVHLVAEDGTIWGQVDAAPAQSPTSQWRAGSRYADLVCPVLGAGAPAGRYRVTMGWYEYPSMRRLGLASGADYVTLGEIEVAPTR
jgi:hypothetical protein